MSRAVRKPKTRSELESMSLDQLDAELQYLRSRQQGVRPVVAKLFDKELAAAEAVRLQKFGVKPR